MAEIPFSVEMGYAGEAQVPREQALELDDRLSSAEEELVPGLATQRCSQCSAG